MKKELYKHMAGKLQAIANCRKSNNLEWLDRHTDSLFALVNKYMPSGSGIDSGMTIDMESSHANRLVFSFSFHHMDEMGGYDGWTEHQLIVTPSLFSGFDMRITGRNRNDIKEYLYQLFDDVLNEQVEA